MNTATNAHDARAHGCSRQTVGGATMSASVAADMHRVASRALGWLHRHRTLATPPTNARPATESTGPEMDAAQTPDWCALPGTPRLPSLDLHPDLTTTPDRGALRVRGPLVDLALVAGLALREGVAGLSDAQRCRDLLDFTWRELRVGDLLWEHQLRHPASAGPLQAYAPFVRAGLRHPALEHLLEHLVTLRCWRTGEAPAHRRLAVAAASHTVGLPGAARELRRAARSGWLETLPEPWTVDHAAAHGVTYAVVHLTDWAAHPAALPPRAVEYLRTWLPVWTDVWGEAGDWDVVAALLAADSCLPQPAAPAADWSVMAQVQHPDGLVPRDHHPVTGDPAQDFRHHHRSTVTAAVAAVLALSRSLDVGVPRQ